MGASRKLQGEIDRVLKKVLEGVELFDSIWNKVYDTDNANQKEKYEADLKKEIKKLQRYRDQIKTWIQSSEIKDKKVSASYEQALLDARKQIEREMERFKICEKETKTKAFSKEGLVQQPKTDPKEKAKSETRDWINNVVGELESQVDAFEAELEGLSVKKGKTRPPRLTHLETSITRHKAHILKMELILRLLDNDELSPEQVNDVKDFLEDYVERNQDDFEDFDDVDELYISLPLDKVEALEDLVVIGQPGHVKVAAASSPAVSSKTSLASSSSQSTSVIATPLKSVSPLELNETASTDSYSDVGPKTPTPKSNLVSPSSLTNPMRSHISSAPVNVSAHPPEPIASIAIPGSVSIQGPPESSGPLSASPNITTSTIEEDVSSVPVPRSPLPLNEPGVVKGVARPSISGFPSVNTSGVTAPSSGITLGSVSSTFETEKRNLLGAEERLANNVIAGRTFSAAAPGTQWRPGGSYQNPNELGQVRGRTEIAPDQREQYLQRFQQGQNNFLGISSLAGGSQKQFSGQQQNSIFQQINSPSTAMPSQVGLGLGMYGPSGSTVTSASLQQQPTSIHQQGVQQGSLSNVPKDADGSHATEEQQQQNPLDDSIVEVTPSSTVAKSLFNDMDSKSGFSKDAPTGGVSGALSESGQLQRDINFSPGQPLQPGQPSSSLGVIGRKSVPDLGAVGDYLGATTPNSGGFHDHIYNYKMLDSAFYKLPQPKDSERARTYAPRHPAVTPSSYPQVQAPVVNNPNFWERMAYMQDSSDTLFFAYYFQPNTYQQYLAAKELKKQAWRFHRRYNTWFQRHEEPEEATDDYEKGSYVYFDFHVGDDDQGWCQRIKQDFTFEYSFLEDELIV
ncbi:hypothetical protein V2J09_014365 [Rumex salicifolius]